MLTALWKKHQVFLFLNSGSKDSLRSEKLAAQVAASATLTKCCRLMANPCRDGDVGSSWQLAM